MKLPHWAQLVLGLLGVVVTWTMNAEASGQLVLPAAGATAIITVNMILGIISPAAQGKVAAGMRRAARISTMALLFVLVGCAAVKSVLENVATTIITDWQQGKSDEQILIDVGEDLAGKTGEDVARVVDDVVGVLLDSGELAQKHPDLLPRASKTKAFARAKLVVVTP